MTENIGLKRNNSDKSLDNLMNTLIKLQSNACKEKTNSEVTEEIQNMPSSSRKTNRTQKQRNKSSKSSCRDRMKRTTKVDQCSKIITWLNKENQDEVEAKRQKKEQKQDMKRSASTKMKRLDISIHKDTAGENCNKNTTKGKSSFKRNPSFEKYGIVMPSFEKIVEDQKKFDEHKSRVKVFDTFDDGILEKSIKLETCDEATLLPSDILDCKHLSMEELNEAIQKHMQTLKDIFNGKKHSARHQKFYKFNMKDLLTVKDLRCSSSLIVFTQTQKDQMLDIMRCEFDPEDKMTNYFFKVLLPELCLLIFMDVHNMTKRKASIYLDERPVDV